MACRTRATDLPISDLRYVAKSFANRNNDGAGQFFLPIVCNDRLYPYVIIRDNPGRVLVAQLLLV